MRFTSQRDYNFALTINKELLNTIIDINVVIYKINVELTSTNIYGEAKSKTHFKGVWVPCLYRREELFSKSDESTINVEQLASFYFLRAELEQKNVYPEQGDIIELDSQYYEIDNVNENQLYAGQAMYNHEIACRAHLTRRITTQLERPTI